MSKLKKAIVIILLICVSLFSMIALSSCGSGDSDGDGLTDSFEEDIGTDADEYTWNDDVDWDQAAENYDGD